MDQLKNYYKEMGVDEKVFDYAQEVEKGLKDRFETLDAIAQLNQIKVLNAMQKHQIAEMHLGGTTGYGYNDSGREAVGSIVCGCFWNRRCTCKTADHMWNTCIRTCIICKLTSGR